MLDNIKAVLFDLDGTLVDSMWVWKQIDIDFMASKNLEMPQDLQKEIEGKSMIETAYYFKDTFGIEDSVEVMMDTWNTMAMDTYSNKVPFKQGAEEFLSKLKERGIKTGICTSNSRELLDAVSDGLGLHRYIDCFMTANEVERGKPSPDIYLAVAKRLGVEPEQCLVFEDIVPGIMAGLNAGMKVCAVDDAYSRECNEEKQKLAHYFIEDYNTIR